jgi:methionine biosynthesis protein MetW
VSRLRPDLQIIFDRIEPGSRVLDVGCGDGALMAALRDGKGCDARGLELDGANVSAAVGRGLSVIQGDADTDLADYPGGSFDYAVLSQTLQTTRRPDLVMAQLLRIGARAFVSFPNFAQWRIRFAHMFGGRMPVTPQLPDRWYDTPNIHHVTIADFQSFLAEHGIATEGAWYLTGDAPRSAGWANLLAEHAVFLLRR